MLNRANFDVISAGRKYRVENNWETPEKEKNTRQRQTRRINQVFILCLPE